MKKVKDMNQREKLHMMVDMIEDPCLTEAVNSLGTFVGKSLSDDRQIKRKKK